MRLSDTLKDLLDDIQEKERELSEMVDAWDDGSPEEASCSDPSDQYCLSEEIARMWKEFKVVVNHGE